MIFLIIHCFKPTKKVGGIYRGMFKEKKRMLVNIFLSDKIELNLYLQFVTLTPYGK
jgi:hypothetical protein